MLKPDYPIHTGRLRLRPFVADDLDQLLDYQSRPDVARYLLWEPFTRADAEQALHRRIARPWLEYEGDMLVLAVEPHGTGTVVGEVNLTWTSQEHGGGEFGFIFHPDHHGHGYAREAATEMLRLGFEELGLHRIIGRADARNTASAGLMTRLGLRKEAHFVRNEIVKGEWTDEVVYAMLADEWRVSRG